MPRVNIDLVEVEKLAALSCTDIEMADWFGIARETFNRRKNKSAEIQLAIERGKSKGRVTLRKAQFDRAKAGDRTMLIWLGKQMLGQTDKVEHTEGGRLLAEELIAGRDRAAAHYAEEEKRKQEKG